jgi:uncharacterized protein (TIGR03067 family)
MPAMIQCPNPQCAYAASVVESMLGKTVKCKRCGTPFVARPSHDGRTGESAKGPSVFAERFATLPADFGRYRVLKLLGRGGMGAVYLAHDTQLERQVALKLPTFDPGEAPARIERFIREARAAASLTHPNICTVFDAGQHEGQPFITMAFIEGQALERALDPEQPMPQRRAAEVTRTLAQALSAAHDRGIVHRDLKPANIMLTPAGDPVIMDFGLAKRLSEGHQHQAKLTRDGAVLGTPGYMAPEQVRGDLQNIGPATDVYSLGVILFELLAGRTPYKGTVGVVMGQILNAPVPPVTEFRADADPRLVAICQRAMAKDPAERFPSMKAFAAALGEFLDAETQSGIAPATVTHLPPMASMRLSPPRVPKKRDRRRGILIGVGMGIAVILVLLGWLLLPSRPTTSEIVIELTGLPNDVEVYIDGERVATPGPDRPLTVPVGDHTLTVKGPKFETIEQKITVIRGERQTIRLKPPKAAQAAAPPAPPKAPPVNLGPTYTRSFQQGINGYQGTYGMAYQTERPPSTGFGARPEQYCLWTDWPVPGGAPNNKSVFQSNGIASVLRFDRIVGDAGHQVPRGARIVAAKLGVTTFDPGHGATLHRIKREWPVENFVATALAEQAKNDWTYFAPATATIGDVTVKTLLKRGPAELDVTADVQAWANGEPNLGWVFLPLPKGFDGWGFLTPANPDVTVRPKLVVEYRLSEPAAPPPTPAAPANDLAALQGVWDVVAEEFRGAPIPAAEIATMKKTLEFTGNRMSVKRTFRDGTRGETTGTFVLDALARPRAFDFVGTHYFGERTEFHGCYEVTGDDLRLVYVTCKPGEAYQRPREFKTHPNTHELICVAKRRKP